MSSFLGLILAALAISLAAPPELEAHPHPAPDSTAVHAHPTASVGRRAAGTVRALAGDLGYLATSPTRARRSDVLWMTGAAIATGVIVANEEAIVDAFHRSRGNGLYDAMDDLGGRLEPVGQMVSVLPYWVGGAALATVFRVEPAQALCLDVIESHLLSGLVRNSAKLVAGRERPGNDGPYQFWKLGTSFPSGHTSVVVELATIFTRRTRRAPWTVRVPVAAVSYGLATCVAVERVDSDAHWPSDVFVGGVTGAFIAGSVVSRNEQRREALAPLLDARGVPVGLMASWKF